MRHTLFAGCALCVLTLILAMTAPVPARAAGLFDWLTGATQAPAAADVPSTADEMPTLPPVDAIDVAGTPAPTFAPIPSSQVEDDGMLRVELRSLDGPQQLHLTLAGTYAVEADPGFRFDRDARLTLSAAEGSVYLAVSGLTIDMGHAVTLTRHRTEGGEQNGIFIDESEKETLYCGDLTVSAEGDSLRAVLKIQAEDYLYGVVAYEMSDSFPIEALKAQAVAARTYAMQRKYRAGTRDWDLVDTTADQVFKGYDAGYVNVVQAVDDTRGVVGMYDGAFATCYYTASNGGQTALPSQILGREGSDGYLAVADDPYDLENPRSPVKELSFGADCGDCDALRAMLETALGEQLAGEGIFDGEWALERIAAIEPKAPLHGGTRMYGELDFTLEVRLLKPLSTPEPASAAELIDIPEPAGTSQPAGTLQPEETPESEADAPVLSLEDAFGGQTEPETASEALEWVTEEHIVALDVYGQIKRGLSLGLNGSDIELIDIQSEADGNGEAQSFTLSMRRFGHGVGMSQRGAQWMAGHYGMGWRQIVAFYYPGMTLECIEWQDAELTELAALPDSVGAARIKPTPTPTPLPLPALKAGEYYAAVTATSLNVRERPTTAATAIDQLLRGRRVIVCSEPDADGWVSIRTAELSGYVKLEYLQKE